MSILTSIGEGKVAKEGAEQGGQIAQLVHMFNAQTDLFNAEFVAEAGKLNVADARRLGKKEVSAQQAAIGASGITAESFDSVSQESAMEIERDILAMELQSKVNEFNLKQSAAVEQAAGEASRFGTEVQVAGIKRGAQAGVVQGSSQLISFF
jgi:hypothetical protein